MEKNKNIKKEVETKPDSKIKKISNKKVGKSFYYGIKARMIVLITALVLLLATGAISILLAAGNMTIHTFTYNEKSVLDYQVCYVENEFFEEECLPRGRQYVASLINNVNTTFNYNFNGSDLFDYTYTYGVTATVVAYERGQPERILLQREEVLLEGQTVEMNESTGFEINEEIEVDYRHFNQIINNFRQEYVLLMDSKIILTLHVEIEGEHPRITQDIEINREISIEIPLSEQTLDVNITYEDVDSSYIIHSENDNELMSIICYSIAGVSLILALIVFIKVMKLISKSNQPKSLYQKRLDKILKEYDLVIVDTKTMPEINDQKVYEIPSMEELLDVQNVLQKPIMFAKVHDEKSVFTVSNDKELYRYVMKAVDVEQDHKNKK